MTVEKIANRQLLFILFITRTVMPMSMLPVLTGGGNAMQDAWISMLIATGGNIILATAIAGLGTKFPRLSIVEYSQRLLGGVAGRLVSLLPITVYFIVSAMEIRMYAEIINTAFLPRTPLIAIIGITMILATIGIISGIEVLGRTADFFALWIAIFLIISLLLPLPEICIENFQPVLARGMEPVISSALIPIAIGAQYLSIGMLLPHVMTPARGISTALAAVIMSMTFTFLSTLVVIGKMSPFEGSQATFPLLTVFRTIETSEFLQRLEILLVLGWGLGIFISASIFLYCGVSALSHWFKTESYRPLVLPAVVIVVIISMLFEDIFQLRTFALTPEISVPLFLLPTIFVLAVLWGAYLIRKLLSRWSD